MLKRCFKVIAVVVLILLPVGIWWYELDLIEPLYREYRLIESVDGFDK